MSDTLCRLGLLAWSRRSLDAHRRFYPHSLGEHTPPQLQGEPLTCTVVPFPATCRGLLVAGAGAMHIAPGRLHHLRLHSTHTCPQLVPQILAGTFEIAARWLGMDVRMTAHRPMPSNDSKRQTKNQKQYAIVI